ncbi:tryptophan--tRNA ligase, partial [Candidatus Woesebacteria bacterium RIFCSPHIGHO2_01_FULL_38_9b]
MQKKRVLSGIRATGRLHLGNYLGAIKGMIALQENPEYETLYMVADLHSINTPYDTKTFQSDVRGVVLDYLSAGLNPSKSTIFIQSQVHEHVELSYLFSSVLTVARMLHLPTYKDKLKENPENANMAMLYYPVLMAADILIYKADAVPVGDDQLPHLEVAREVARKMNEKYGT